MALVEQLVAQVPNAALRKAIEREVADLKKRLTWGLVFERHIPETTLLLDAPVRPGAVVWERRAAKPRRFRVRSVVAGGLLAAPEAEGETAPPNAKPTLLAPGSVLVEKPFGEPVYPALSSLGATRNGPGDKPSHAVIEGENFHALQALLVTYEGKVDCIYLDPPYNSGARDWKYNNHYVDGKDTWRHSKWLSFLDKRLRLAKRLLRPDGVLVITIDEHEIHHLGMLLEQLFPDYLIYTVSIVVNSRGSTGTRNFGMIEEYAIFVVPDIGYDVIRPRETFVTGLKAGPPIASVDADDDDGREDEDADMVAGGGPGEPDDGPEDASNVYWRGAVRTGQGTSFRSQRPRQFYPLFIDPDDHQKITVGSALLGRTDSGELLPPSWEPVNGLIPIWPIDEEGAERVWCYEPGRMATEVAANNIQVGRFNPARNTFAVNVRRVRRTERRFRERSIWWEQSYDAGSNGTNVLKKFLGTSGAFPFPKSIYAVRDVLATVVGNRPDALIVDFFAGSGTTLHSTCLLNAIDNGRRTCILVTNNEVDAETAQRLNKQGFFPGDPAYEREGIFEKVTMPRVIAAIVGHLPGGAPISGNYKWAAGRLYREGFPENVEFFRLDYLDPIDVELGLRFEALLPIWWLKSGGIGVRDRIDPAVPFSLPAGCPYAFMFDPSGMPALLAGLAARPDVTHAYVVADTDDAFADLASQLPRHLTTTLLYRPYLDAVRGMHA